MRYGCCSNLLSGGPGGFSGTGIEFAERIAAVGFDYIEMPLSVIVQMDEAEFEAMAARLDRSGLTCEVCTNFLPSTLQVTGPDIDQSAIDRHITAAFRRAGRLGAECVVFGSGRSRSVPAGFPIAAAWDQLASLLRRIAPLAEKERLTIVIEPLRRQESNIINTYAEACRLAREVSHPNVRALVDYYHLATEREPAEAIVAGASWLRHVHYASLEGRRFPIALDDDRNRDFFRALKAAGYDGRISLEAFTSDFDREAPAALQFIRKQVDSARPLGQPD